jgi:MoxR-like ATPase
MGTITDVQPDLAQLKSRIERFQAVRDNILSQVREVIVGQ